MAFKRPKILILLVLLLFALPHCGDFRAIFNGKPSHRVAKSKKAPKSKKRRNQTPPKDAQGYFIWPLQAPLSSLYGPRGKGFHDGIDIDGDTGDPVQAAAAGNVVFEGSLGGYGKLIVVKHSNGYFTAYAHNKKNLVKKGKFVRKGDQIALVGATGHATGAHLHFEIRDKNGTYNPLDFLPQRRYSRK